MFDSSAIQRYLSHSASDRNRHVPIALLAVCVAGLAGCSDSAAPWRGWEVSEHEPDVGIERDSERSTTDVPQSCEPTSFESARPLIYFLLDTSGSMCCMPDRMQTLKQAMDNLVDNTSLLRDYRVGIAAFSDCQLTNPGVREVLDLSSMTTVSEFEGSYANLEAAGNTPTGAAIEAVLLNGWLEDTSAAQLDEKRIIVITDGDPTSVCEADGYVDDEAVEHTAARARDAAEQGIGVYFIGFDNLSAREQRNMQSFAEAGGTGTWSEVSSRDSSSLERVVTSIADLQVCVDP